MLQSKKKEGKTKVTIRDLAGKSGLSVATISRYFTRSTAVSADVASRIESFATRLRYRHGPVGRKKLLRREAVGLLVAKKMRVEVVADVVLEEIRDRLGLAAEEAGLELVILESYQKGTTSISDDFFRRRILFEGLRGVFLYGDWDPKGIPEYCRKRQLPLIHLNRMGTKSGFVAVDPSRCGFLATEHLLSRGHRSAGIVIPAASELASGRIEGWRAAHEARGKIPGPIFDIPTAGLRQGYAWMKDHLENSKKSDRVGLSGLTAVFVNNDATALGVLRALGEVGLRTPEDLALVGCDDLELASYSRPSLTTVRQDFGKLCGQAMRRMKDVLAGEISEPPKELIEPELVIRESA